jgi:hypothetical protein
MFKWMGIATALYLVAWIVYLEVSPSMGNVWWRTGTTGAKEFTPWGIWATVIAPFKRGHGILWTPTFWDVNPWPVLGILGFIGTVSLWHRGGMAGPSSVLPPHLHAADKMSQ